MDRIKPYFIIPYWISIAIAFSVCLYFLISNGIFTPWLGAFIALLSSVIYIILIIGKMVARTSQKLWSLIIFPILGALIAVFMRGEFELPLSISILNLIGNILYIYWYSNNNRRPNPLLEVGKILPEFSLKTIDGELITSSFIKSEPALILFFRGNWCSICMKQIQEVSDISKDLHNEGINIYMIGAQSLEETKKIAHKYKDGVIQFLFDPYYRTLGELNLLHINGLPIGITGFDRDTAYPTILLANYGGQILWSDQTNHYRIRPKPEVLLGLKRKITGYGPKKN